MKHQGPEFELPDGVEVRAIALVAVADNLDVTTHTTPGFPDDVALLSALAAAIQGVVVRMAQRRHDELKGGIIRPH